MEKQLNYPCKGCKRVADPQRCENKRCAVWNKWFMQRWSMIHGWYRKHGASG